MSVHADTIAHVCCLRATAYSFSLRTIQWYEIRNISRGRKLDAFITMPRLHSIFHISHRPFWWRRLMNRGLSKKFSQKTTYDFFFILLMTAEPANDLALGIMMTKFAPREYTGPALGDWRNGIRRWLHYIIVIAMCICFLHVRGGNSLWLFTVDS